MVEPMAQWPSEEIKIDLGYVWHRRVEFWTSFGTVVFCKVWNMSWSMREHCLVSYLEDTFVQLYFQSCNNLGYE